MAMSMTFLCGIFCFAVWVPSSSFAPLIVFALLGGPVAGTFWAVSLHARFSSTSHKLTGSPRLLLQ